MKLSRLLLLVLAGCGLLGAQSLFADDFTSPFGADRQFSVDMVITTKDGTSMACRVYGDMGKMRTEMNQDNQQIVTIVRPDLKKVYSVMAAQKMVMEMPYKGQGAGAPMAASAGPQGKFELVGPDTVDGVACTKYKVTSDKDGKVFLMWINPDTKAPVKMVAEDNSITINWKNYQVAPQDAALFEPPAGYQVMSMPSGAAQ